MCVCGPSARAPFLGSETDPGREAEKLHPVRNAWIALRHMAFHAHNRLAIQGVANVGTAFRPNDLRLTARSGLRAPLSLLVVVMQDSLLRRVGPFGF